MNLDKFINVYVIEDPIEGGISERYRLDWSRQRATALAREYVGEECYVCVNGRTLEDDEAKHYRTRNGDQVLLVPKVAIGGAIVQAVAGAAFAATATGMMIATVINMAFMFVVTSLMPKPEPPALGPQDSFHAGWNPRTHQQTGLVRPRPYGKCRCKPNILSSSTSTTDGDETVSILCGFGRGPIKGFVADTTDLNDQPIDNYTDVTTDTRRGTLNQTAISIQDGGSVEYYPAREVPASSSVTYTTPDDDFSDLAVVLEFPQGCFAPNSRGGIPYFAYKIEISPKDAGTWSTLVSEEVFILNDGSRYTNWYDVYHSNSGPPRKRFVLEFLASGTYSGGSPVSITRGTRYDIKVTRWNVTYYFNTASSTPGTPVGAATSHDTSSIKMNLHMVREYAMTTAEGTPTHPGTVLMAIDALLTGQLQNQLDISAVLEGRILRTYNGTSWTLEYSNNPAWVIWDLLTLPVISGDGDGTAYAIEEYEGLDPSHLTPYLADFYALAQRCDTMVDDGNGSTEKYATFNGVFDTETTPHQAIQKVCRAAGCILVPAGTGYTVIIDQAGSAVQMFNTANISGFKRSYYAQNQLASTIEGNYWPESADYQKTTLPRTNAAAGGANIKKTMDLVGVTSDGQADRILTKELLKNQYNRSRVEFNADIDAIAVRVGDNFTLQHDSIKADGCEHARIQSVTDTNTIVLDRTFDDTSGLTSITVRTAAAAGGDDLTTYTIDTISVGSTTTTVDITSTWAITPRQYDLVTLGSPQEYRCLKIEHHDDLKRKITGEEYHSEVYANGTPTIPIVGRGAIGAGRTRLLTLSADDVANQGNDSLDPIKSDIPSTTNITWTGNGTDTATWSATESGDPLLVLHKGYYFAIQATNTTDQYIYWDASAPYAFQTTNDYGDIDHTNEKFHMATNNDGVVSLVVASGAVTNYDDLTGTPTQLADINTQEGTDLTNATGWATAGDPTKIDINVIVANALDELNTNLGNIIAGTITGAVLRTGTTGRRIRIDTDGIKFYTANPAGGVVGTTANGGSNIVVGTTANGGDNAYVGTGYLARFYNIDSGVPFDVQAEQTVGDVHLYNRSSDPSGAAAVGDLCVVSGTLKICTSAGTPGTWTTVGTQT